MNPNSKFILKALETVNNTPACDGQMSKLAHCLSEAIDRLEAVVSQADAQFNCGDKHATFNKQFIDSIR